MVLENFFPVETMNDTQSQRPKTKDQSPKTGEVAAVVLAAGKSARMGAFKPLLPFGSQTVIESSLQSLRAGGVQTIVVVVGQGENALALAAKLADADVIIAVNAEPESEMNSSIAAGVAALPESTKAVLITPADHPAVPDHVVQKLIAEWEHGAVLAKPTWHGQGGHPVLVDLSFREELLQLDPATGLKGFFTAHQDQVRRIPVNSNYVARDIDTWDDYRALHLEVFGFEPPSIVRLRTSDGKTDGQKAPN